MIHARRDYDHIQDPTGKIPLDEPVFLVRGQDPNGWRTVVSWYSWHTGVPVDQILLGLDEPETGHQVGFHPTDTLGHAIYLQARRMRAWAQNCGHGPASVPDGELRTS